MNNVMVSVMAWYNPGKPMLDLQNLLAAYGPSIAGALWTPLSRTGGYSGARLWRGLMKDGRQLALKCYPTAMSADQLKQIHRWLAVARTAGLAFVPQVASSRDGGTVAVFAGRSWEVVTWMPGRADFHDAPTAARLTAAMAALGRIHGVWAVVQAEQAAPCPAIKRRWLALSEWESVTKVNCLTKLAGDDPLHPLAQTAQCQLPDLVPAVRARLKPWLHRTLRVQPCLGDVWHDHILFSGDEVVGVIDYGAAKIDTPAADLARLLGSLIPDEHDRTRAALAVYSSVCQPVDFELVDILDTGGTVGAIVNWLKRIVRGDTGDRAAAALRFGTLVRRLPALRARTCGT